MDHYEAYDEMLDDVYGTVTIAGIEYVTSRVLRVTDPTAYDTGYADYLSFQEEETDDA